MRRFAIGVSLMLGACASAIPPVETSSKPIVIAHRGASGLMPEHTLAAYNLAIEQGADFIEPDLVMTKDGVLIDRHDPWLSDTTDVADHPEFADRKTTVTDPSGKEITDWFAWDFTLEEIKTLRATQPRPSRDQSYNGQFEIPTFEEVINLVGEENALRGQRDPEGYLGIYPELKWPTHHKERGLEIGWEALSMISQALVDKRTSPPREGYIADDIREAAEERHQSRFAIDPCYQKCQFRVRIQSFEADILKELNGTTDLKLVQLVSPIDAAGTPSYELEDIATYADGVGPFKSLVMDLKTGEPTGYAEQAKALGLEVHPWTFRDDDIAPGFATPEDEINAILDAGVTGLFTDFPATGRAVVDSRQN